MKTPQLSTHRLAVIALTLIASLGFNPASADPVTLEQTEDKMVDASKLIDWSQKINLQLTATLDQRLSRQLVQSKQASQPVLATNLPSATAQRIQAECCKQDNAVTPSPIMPVVIQVNREADNLINL